MFFKKITYPTWGFIALAIILALVTDNNVEKQQRHLWKQQLEQESLENTLILAGQLEVIDQELMGIVSLFEASETVDRSGFKTYVTPLLQKHEFIHSLQWIPRVLHEHRPILESLARRDGFRNFQFKVQTENSTVIPSLPKDQYFPIYYIEPSSGNEPVLGFDISTQPQLLNYMNQARDSGKSIASNTKVWFQNESRMATLIFTPFYAEKGTPKTIEERKRLFRGTVLGVYRTHDMMEEMIRPYLTQGLFLSVFDEIGEDQKRLIFGGIKEDAPIQYNSLLNFSGRRWLLLWQGTSEFQNGPNRAYAIWLSVSVFSFLVFIAIFFQMMASRTRHVENEVNLRTNELTLANQQLKSEVEARQLAEEKLHTAKNEAETANKAKSTFLANMSHEIRTPMNAILGYAQILHRNTDLNVPQQKNIKNILESGGHLLHIINDILDISKIEAGKMELQTVDFNLNQTIRTIAAIVKPRCEEKNLKWALEGPGPQAIPIHGDEFKLKQILINLLSNAVKFTDSGKIELKWSIVKHDHYLFQIIDSGRGIPLEDRNKIFEPFQQIGSGAKQEGTGLGLAIVRKQIELMGGVLTLHSTPEDGSEFNVTLHLPPAKGSIPTQSLLGTNVSRLAKGQQVKALVADDNLTNRNVLSGILEDVGVETITADNGRDAIKKIHTHQPDIVFMDMRMPIMDGVEAIKQISKEFPEGNIKTVAVSASALDNERKDFIAVGCNDYISKPVQIERVLECMANLLKIEYEYIIPDHDRSATETPIELAELKIPEDLFSRMIEAARLHNISDLKVCLNETEELGESGHALLQHLYPLVTKYDMGGIHKALNQIKLSDPE